ncbi:MAG: ferritin-like domain-containing protein [Candidatus Dormibacteria bacterium]|jgi:hypothetical protein
MFDDDLRGGLAPATWDLSRDIDFDAVEVDKLTPEWIVRVRDVCLAELSGLEVTEPLLRDFHDDPGFHGFVSVWLCEEMGHHLVLRRYLERTGHPVERVRLPAHQPAAFRSPAIDTLTLRFCAERRLAERYGELSAEAPEPVLRRIFAILAVDELRHAAVYARYLRQAVEGDPAVLPAVLRMALWAMRIGHRDSRRAAGAAVAPAASRGSDPHFFDRMMKVYRTLAPAMTGLASGCVGGTTALGAAG